MRNLTLLTDLYQLTMGYGFYKNGKHEETVTFDLFFRRRELISYSIAAGLEQAMDYLLNWHFDDEDIAYLRSLNLFDEEFLAYIKNMRFTGDVYAVREGEIVFPSEPILTVKAPLIQAQFAETALLNIINHQTLIATKSSKISRATGGNGIVMEFGLRRAQGPDAGIYGARAAIIGGCSSTSNVLAGQMFDVPVAGTMAHSFVMDYPTEYDAFRAYAKAYPDSCMLLVDTYDTLRSGIPNAIKVFKELKEAGHTPKGIRLDSGDLAYLSKKARKMLDDAGFPEAKICVSGDLDERLINSLLQQGAKIDTWGIGTKLITSEDLPSLGGVYKLSSIIGENGETTPKIKLSDNTVKITNPGFKSLYRLYDKTNGMAIADLITLHDETVDENQPLTLFHPVETWKEHEVENFHVVPLQHTIVKDGKLVYKFPTLKEIQAFSKEEISKFWEEYLRLDMPQLYKVDLSQKLHALKIGMIDSIRKNAKKGNKDG
ncbi:MAG: nicotinate phosphoribosyltransferase [Clostridiales bacterium]|nr:nicotinate phosphoribosyltransferase [Clostridiales bacterium]